MEEEKKTLADELILNGALNRGTQVLTIAKVREFIRQLNEELFEEAIKRGVPLTDSSLDRLPLNYIKLIIDKLAGPELVK